MKYKLLALDMDGTTLNSEKKISAATANAISELIKSGVNVVLSTGRGLAELADYSKEIKPINYGILISGGMIYDFFEKKPIISHALQEKIMFELIDGAVAENAMISEWKFIKICITEIVFVATILKNLFEKIQKKF